MEALRYSRFVSLMKRPNQAIRRADSLCIRYSATLFLGDACGVDSVTETSCPVGPLAHQQFKRCMRRIVGDCAREFAVGAEND